MHRPGRSIMPVHDSTTSIQPTTPRNRQSCSLEANPNLRYVTWTLLAAVIVSLAVAIIVLVICYKQHDPVSLGFLNPVPAGLVGFSLSADRLNGTTNFFLGFLILATIQSSVVITMHTAELAASISRDESIRRRACSEKGTSLQTHPFKVIFMAWQLLFLFTFKPVLQWMFGLGFFST